MRVLVGVDDSKWSRAAINFVASMKWPTGTELLILSAASPMSSALAFQTEGLPIVTQDMLELQLQHHRDVVERCALDLQGTGLPVRTDVAMADPRDAIVDCAKRENTDLVVVGSHGRSGLKKLLMGSVSSHVVAHAPCSVVVVKLPDQYR